MSEATRKIVNINTKSNGLAISPPSISYRDDEIIETPQKFQLSYKDNNDTPTTPTFDGTPFKTCDVKSTVKSTHKPSHQMGIISSDFDNIGKSNDKSTTPVVISVKSEISKEEVLATIIESNTSADNYNDNDNDNNISKDSDSSIGFISPPKTKILEPRKNESSANLIPAITSDEWSTAPVFLKKQVTLEIVNKALVSINSILMDKRDTLTQTEMDDTISQIVDSNIPPKAVILALVQLKKLDLGTDSLKQKVYKIRRFY